MKPRRIFIPLSGWLLAAAGATAQTPSAIDVARTELFRQTSAVELRPEGARLVVTVAFSAPPPAGTTVRMRTPRDTLLALERQPDGSFAGSRAFSSAVEREAEFPEGVQVFLVGSGGAEAATSFAVFNTAAIGPSRVFNFDELQALPSSAATVRWAQIPDVRRDDSLSFGIARGDGTAAGVVPASLAGDTGLVQVTGLPLFTVLTGTLAYTRATVTTVLNSGATRATVSRGFSVQFPLLCNPAPPEIIAQPQPQAANPGDEVRFTVNVRGLAPWTFQWRKDGSPLAGATLFDLILPNVQLAHAGRYSVEAVSPAGRVTSEPALLAIAPTLRYSLHAGTPGYFGSGDGPPNVARFQGLGGLAIDAAGNLLVADVGNNAIRRASPSGVVSSVAGLLGPPGFADGPAATARFAGPQGLAVDTAGNIYVADSDNHVIRKISPAGIVSTFAGAAGQPGAVDGPPTQARFRAPQGMALDAGGNLFVADLGNSAIRRVTPAGLVSTFAGALNAAGFLDGTGAAARLTYPGALTIDPAGTLWVADVTNTAVRKISRDGSVTTFAILPWLRLPRGLAVDGRGDVYVANSFGGIVRLTADGALGGTVSRPYAEIAADFSRLSYFSPVGLALDRQGALFVADSGNMCVLKATLVPGSGDPGIAIEAPPAAQRIAVGGSAVLSVAATGPGLYYQWRKDGVPIAGASKSQLVLTGTTVSDTGGYSVLVGNFAGAVVSPAAALTFAPPGEAGRLVNLSVRTRAGTGAATLIVGVAVGGSGARPLLVRGVGPGLAAFGVGGALADPSLAVFRGSQAIAANDNWGGTAALSAAFSAVGAFPLAAASLDAAITDAFPAGAYSVQVTGRGAASGVSLAEIYEAPGGPEAASARLVNVSARAAVGTGADILIAGFTVFGPTSRTLLIRAAGPTLAEFGVAGALDDPVLRVFAGSAVIAANDNWDRDLVLAAAAIAVGAFPLNSRQDSALLLTLPPGSYSAQVTGARDATGVALIEIYEMP